MQERATKFAENSQQYAEYQPETTLSNKTKKLNLGQIDEAAALFKLAIAVRYLTLFNYRFAVLRADESETSSN